jgi:Glycosyl transferase family 2
VASDRRCAGNVAGVCIVRNAVDLAPFLCGHYLGFGFAHLAFIDDGSSDGTFEYLSKIANRTGRVSVRQVHYETFEQQTLMTESLNALIAAGYSIIVPFDADEFWNVDAAQFERLSDSVPEQLFSAKWVNFVQARRCQVSSRLGLLNMVYRASATMLANKESIIRHSQSFVCLPATKIAFKTRGNVEISRGQHELLKGPDELCQLELEIFHLPLRSRQEVIERALNERRRAPKRPHTDISWQSKFHSDTVAAGNVDAVWAANSYDAQGRLDVYGKPMNLIRDMRLRRLLIRALRHFATVGGPAFLYHGAST